MPSHSITISVSTGNGGASATKSYSAESEFNIGPVTVPGESTDLELLCPIDVGQLRSLFILSSKDMTIETNNGTTPDDTITLKAGVPLIWNADMDAYFDSPLTEDILSIFLTTGDVGDASFELHAIIDATP